VVPPEHLKKLFSKDLAHAGYIVLEVAIYPEAGSAVDFGTGEFTLRVGSDPAILPSLTPRSVASGEKPAIVSKSKVPQLPGNVHVYTTETIGYETGGYGRKGGVYTGTSTTVGVGNAPVYYPDPGQNRPPKDSAELQRELQDKALPEGRTTQPVAGYLYFQRPKTKEKDPTYQLTWYRVGGDVHLRLPGPK
jgi:hypothetical protein